MAAPSERGNHPLLLRQIAAGLDQRGIPTVRGVVGQGRRVLERA